MKARLACCTALALIVWFGHTAAQSQTAPQEYRTTAKQETVLQSELVSVPGKEGTVLRVELPPGWIGDWHYHTGDVSCTCFPVNSRSMWKVKAASDSALDRCITRP